MSQIERNDNNLKTSLYKALVHFHLHFIHFSYNPSMYTTVQDAINVINNKQ